jgi:hypothetical protein
MSAVARLALTYFGATTLTRRLAAIGTAAMIIGIVGSAFTPGYFVASLGRELAWYEILILVLPWLGLVLLVASTALMPAIVERMTLGRAVWVLPYGRVRLLLSVLVPAALLAILTAAGATVAFVNSPFDLPVSAHLQTFYRTFVMAFVDFGLIYMAIWLVGKTSGVWRLGGMLWIVISITIPLRYVGGSTPFSLLEGFGLVSWVVFAALLLAGGRARHSFQAARARLKTVGDRAWPALRYTGGDEVNLLLGTTRPWIVALGQAIPIGLMVWFVPYAPIWIVYLVTFSAIAGAMTSKAAAQSRRLWLKYDWTREQIRRHVEWSYWRYNAVSLGVLVLIYAGLATYEGYFDRQAVLLSIALIVLGGIACTYLGLMITRGLSWFESALGILTMIVLVLAAFAIVREQYVAAVELEVLIAALGVIYALMARQRWDALDWMQCRLDTPVRGAA